MITEPLLLIALGVASFVFGVLAGACAWAGEPKSPPPPPTLGHQPETLSPEDLL